MSFLRILFSSLLIIACAGVAIADEPELPPNALLALPDGEAPRSGWPTIVLLHGYGTNKEDFIDFSAILSQNGVAAISVDAPIELGSHRRSWPREAEKSYAALRPSLDFIEHDDRLNAKRLFVGGFSQGAYHSMLIGKSHPSEFVGLLIISPGGGSVLPEGWRGKDVEQALYVIYGNKENARIKTLVQNAATEWRNAKHPVKVESHDGGHHFPANWETVLGKAMNWLLSES